MNIYTEIVEGIHAHENAVPMWLGTYGFKGRK